MLSQLRINDLPHGLEEGLTCLFPILHLVQARHKPRPKWPQPPVRYQSSHTQTRTLSTFALQACLVVVMPFSVIGIFFALGQGSWDFLLDVALILPLCLLRVPGLILKETMTRPCFTLPMHSVRRPSYWDRAEASLLPWRSQNNGQLRPL